MERSQIKVELLDILKDFAKAKDVTITEELDLVNDLQIKSAKLVDIILVFEDRYGVEVEPDDIDDMFTVGEALDILERYLKTA